MFKKKEEKAPSPVPGEQIQAKGIKILVMPEQFFPKAIRKRLSPVLILILAVVFLGFVGGAVILFYRSVSQPVPVPVAVVEQNLNIALIENLNEEINENLNINLNANINAELNANLNVPPAVAPVQPVTRTLPFTQDTDQDKLTDLEEDVYGTDSKRPDTDGDGHLDGNEVVNLFNPAQLAPSALEDSGLVKIFPNEKWGYFVSFPAKWVSRPIDADQREVMFTSALGEFVDILIQDNPKKLSVAEWYAQQSPGINPNQLEVFVTKRGMRGVRSIDGLTVYLVPDAPDQGTVVYTVSYNAGTATAYNYISSWQMMINSFRVSRVINIEPVPQEPAPAQPQPVEPTPTPAPIPPPVTPINQNENSNTNVAG